MKLVFCSNPLTPRKPDETYDAEVMAADRLGIPHVLVDHDALVNEAEPARAVRRVPDQTKQAFGVYRGWMVTPKQYQELFDALEAKGIRLINDPAAYKHCHHLPESYSLIEKHTPKSVWIETKGDVPMDEIMQLLLPFGSRPIIVKDFVKSRKHEWAEACFIPSASDRVSTERVVRRFLDLQSDDLNEGLVFREFVELEPLACHSKSGMPLTKEFRIFFLDGKPIFWTEYWEEGNYGGLAPAIERFAEVGSNVKSRFFTMDVAKRRDGDWMIVELGDAQVAGLPENASVDGFYKALLEHWTSTL